MSRTKAPRDLAEQQALQRIAVLASHIMHVLRSPGHGEYSSERQLRAWLAEDGIAYTDADLTHALTLLESTGRLIRAPWSKATASRAGWIPTVYSSSPKEVQHAL
jgi:hypothetical protein